MELAIVAGIPYPKPTAKQRALEHFCELRFGHGWEHAVKAPTARKLQQAIGRLIRSETDVGVAVILDKRAVHFVDSLQAKKTTDLLSDVEGFFEDRKAVADELTIATGRPRGG
jgi:DNA excision repair protein ERCC-2